MKTKKAAKSAALGMHALATKGLTIKRHCANNCYIVQRDDGAFVGYVLADADEGTAVWEPS